MKCNHEVLTCNSCGQVLKQEEIEIIRELNKVNLKNEELIAHCNELKQMVISLEAKNKALRDCLKEVL